MINHEIFDYEEMKRLTLKLAQENEEKAVESEKNSVKIDNILKFLTNSIFYFAVVSIFGILFAFASLIFSMFTSTLISISIFIISLFCDLYLYRLRREYTTFSDKIKKKIYNMLDKHFPND